MVEPQPPQPLDYARSGVGPHGPTGFKLALAISCLVVGALMASLGLAVAAKYYLDDAKLAVDSSVFAGVGLGLCCVGMWLKRKKPAQ